ncbi:hypothetical protein TWF106_006305 [Orbilia oligospora]|uniref:Myb-like domain-containing protein n=1 Tax=Orbilia oligospora TaxID=2813651 RepID=A0A6G1M913_ORBOL|nr:hypothetical protein TWF106_006305 [Orbilia oligospora]KAF3230863.1 hypothetical protein TWF191_008704 [Orbilia oligospora]KAF3250228.1 hypothetical protein TWF192_005249 [Orbilia oligospora]
MADQVHNEEAAAAMSAISANNDDDNSTGNEVQPVEGAQEVSAELEQTVADDERSNEVKAPNDPIDEAKPSPEATKPARKRGRPSKSSNSGEDENKKKKSKTSAKESTENDKSTIESEDIKGAATTENSARGRGRKAGTAGSGGWTSEQDAYLRQLYQQTSAIKEIYEKFEAKFSSGKSPNSLRLRWGKLKRDSLVLSPKEEEILKRAIYTVENNKAAAVLDIYVKEGGEGVTKLTQTFVAMQLKKWGGVAKSISKGQENEGDVNSDDES